MVQRRNELRFVEQKSLLRCVLGGSVQTIRAIRDHRDVRKFRAGERLYADGISRLTYRRVLAHRLLGSRLAPLPLDGDRYWREYKVARAQVPVGSERPGGMGFQVPVFDLRPLGFDMTARMRANGILAHFLQRQYELHHPGVDITVRPGDVVIDGGGAWGETALLFATQAGREGRVVSFEAMPEMKALFLENLDLNPELAGRIELVDAILWDCSDEQLTMSVAGPGSRVTAGAGQVVRTATIDSTVKRLGVPRVDFIKMDIEGSELRALEGARRTLVEYRPRLAISAYHKPGDIVELAQWLTDLDLDYRLYLDHFTDHGEETVLFATVD